MGLIGVNAPKVHVLLKIVAGLVCGAGRRHRGAGEKPVYLPFAPDPGESLPRESDTVLESVEWENAWSPILPLTSCWATAKNILNKLGIIDPRGW